jgi:hypothetical protein
MLGLRPRLKARPSLLDLVRRDSIDQISQRPALLEPDDHTLGVPLPQSPVLAPSDVEIVVSEPYESEEEPNPEVTMSKQQQQDDGDEQVGAVFSISGPVIVAANMIGCAMYELVGGIGSFK